MKKLHAKLIDPNQLEPKEGQCDGFACSNKKSITHCPSFGFNNNYEDVALNYLARILVEAFLDKKEYEHNKSNEYKESSFIL